MTLSYIVVCLIKYLSLSVDLLLTSNYFSLLFNSMILYLYSVNFSTNEFKWSIIRLFYVGYDKGEEF